MALDLFGTLYRLAEEIKSDLRKIIHESQWREAKLLEHVSPEVAEKIWIEFNINKLDPDFSFDEWAKQYDAEIEARRPPHREE